MKPLWQYLSKPRLLVADVKNKLETVIQILEANQSDILDVSKELLKFFSEDSVENRNLHASVLRRAKNIEKVIFDF